MNPLAGIAVGDSGEVGQGWPSPSGSRTGNSGFLYVRNGIQNAINAFAVNEDGSLSALAGVGDLHAGAAGLAAR